MKTPHRLGRLLCRAAVLVGLWTTLSPLAAAQPEPLPRAHAHNDYEHNRPLHDALDRGFCSVEADVHLVDGELLVAHDRVDVQPEHTLQALYLDPLRKEARRQQGTICSRHAPFYLLVDIKSEAEATYAVLREVLRRYADILTIFSPIGKAEGAVTVIVSGNRPRAVMANEITRYAGYDGRLEDLSQSRYVLPSFIPMISASWDSISDWDGAGEMPPSTRKEIQRIVRTAHAQGRIVRFWGTPDHPAVWAALYDAGVDLLNTDNLDGLRAFLLQQEED